MKVVRKVFSVSTVVLQTQPNVTERVTSYRKCVLWNEGWLFTTHNILLCITIMKIIEQYTEKYNIS